ncbi:dienelactone hydrolase family protein [Spirillospora sp. NPDC048911]|uniref:dienelactone hydrolase family protein n=1 Tax=Spirillospora sp. NPDC048911 TaxID=3364527 RepID=UPI00371E445A
MPDDDLSDFETATFTHEGKTRTIFRRGTGPAVIVMAEMPGITPKVTEFARMVAGIGCTAVMPHLFGRPGRDARPDAHGWRAALSYTGATLVPACISKEFTVMATGRSSPVVDWLRALAASEHERCGGPGVGAIGMCFTGGFALAMATDDRLLAPVLSQPSLPLPFTRRQRNSIDISSGDLAKVKGRCANGLTVLGLRFEGDSLVPRSRFEFLRRELGDAFVAVELPDASANPDATLPRHSVVTEHLIDEPGEPTRAALDQVLDHFRNRLLKAD